MAQKTKVKTLYVCSQCGYESPKWLGKCPECESWNTMTEESRVTVSGSAGRSISAPPAALPSEVRSLEAVSADESVRYKTGMRELDRVLGGGIVPGAAILVCGDPGIGKSTILLQMCGTIQRDLRILYVCGEESMRQVKLRANRLGVDGGNILMTASTDAEQLHETILQNKPDLVIVDSIQTLSIRSISSSCGSVTQVRECTQLLMNVCKSSEIPLFVVGHVNKDGGIAGPKVLEHMVDTVLYFEGDRNLSYRILRSIKNRFGSTNEIGVFQMEEGGLHEVENPSEMLLAGRPLDVSGTCITCLMEGTRPLLVEVQALVAKTSFGNPRRISTGFDYNRAALLIAVLEKRAGYFMGNLDVFLNIAGGMRIDEPVADLAVVLALVSNLVDRPIHSKLLALGEVGLTGEVRSASHVAQRVGEAYRLGFDTFVLPRSNLRHIDQSQFPQATFYGVSNISEAFRAIQK
ncbi:DNA repair protein RadA [Angelakisella massiliensis]|uniref:DNA repair protein RadA n=1 Tax=Angelakisella massiliensis TaxID=1871018 RepID=UPI000AE92D3B